MEELNKIFEAKKELRKLTKDKKASCSLDDMLIKSNTIIGKLESLQVFKSAKTILAYNSMPDEVNTHDFIARWAETKDIYLPVVLGESLMEFRKYDKNSDLQKSDYGILEPTGRKLKDLHLVDLIVVPGVAFDSDFNRMGRGKAYYDTYLQTCYAAKIGICFDFQLVNNVPYTESDIKMDCVITNEELFISNCIF